MEFKTRELAELLPGLNAMFVAALELNDVGVSGRFKGLLLVESLLRVLVEGLQVRDLWLL